MVKERDELRRALALLNTELRVGINLDVEKFLDRHGFSSGGAIAMAELVTSMRERGAES